jgi:hypothetical protein
VASRGTEASPRDVGLPVARGYPQPLAAAYRTALALLAERLLRDELLISPPKTPRPRWPRGYGLVPVGRAVSPRRQPSSSVAHGMTVMFSDSV